MATSITADSYSGHALMPNQVVAHKITDIMATYLDLRALFKVDTELQQSAGMTKRVYKYTYSGEVEKLAKGAKNNNNKKGKVALEYTDYAVERYQHTYEYNDMDVMADPNIVNVLSDGAGKTLANEVRAEYFTELAKISNTFDATSYDSVYEAAVDAIASLDKAAEKDINDLFLVMGADGRAAVRKDKLFEASKQGEILYTGQFGTISGVPCVYSNSVPEGKIYLTEPNAITFFVKKEGTVEQDRDIESKDNVVVYERHGVVALTDDTRSSIITFKAASGTTGATGASGATGTTE